MIFFENFGYCPCCEKDTKFVAKSEWLRDDYICENCDSIPRERALMLSLNRLYPDWRQLTIHESSPVFRGASKHIKEECQNYIPTFYYPDRPLGSFWGEYRCENLENLTFANDSIDIHITQDVFEHILDPKQAFKEIARTLKPGGAHIFTVPLVNKSQPSKVRAYRLEDGTIRNILGPVFHGDPINEKGSLVTMDWGYDIGKFIFDETGLFTQIIYIDDISKGIRAELIEVLVTRKDGHTEFDWIT